MSASNDPRAKDKTVTGGKGSNLAEMADIGLPVPPGFTITTEECVRYLAEGGDFSDQLRADVAEALTHVERTVGKSFGDAADPLLVSVRSGARVSMPGMMDTVLNLGLNDATVAGLASISGDERFAWDSYRRFIQMYSDVVLGLEHGLFEEALEIAKEDNAYYTDTELTADDCKALVGEYKRIVARRARTQTSRRTSTEQLWGAIARGIRQLGFATAPRSTAGSTTFPATGAPRSTCRRWCSATWARPAPPALPSPAILRPARRPITANGWSTPRARTSSPASARRNT